MEYQFRNVIAVPVFIEAIPHSSANGTISSWQQSQIAVFTALSGYSGPIVDNPDVTRSWSSSRVSGKNEAAGAGVAAVVAFDEVGGRDRLSHRR